MKINFKKTAIVLIAILVVLLGTGIYRRFVYDPNKITAQGVQSTPIPSETPIPEELTQQDSIFFLVNKNHPIDSSYEPSDLVDPEYVNSTSGVFTLRYEAAGQLQSMVAAAKEAGIDIYVSSAYRPYKEEDLKYTNALSLYTSEAAANMDNTKAGYSEHQLGLAVDLTDSPDTPNETTDFANTDAGKWLAEHAHEYGFILRYPEGKEDITGYSFAPWHFRYVGTDTSYAMYDSDPNITMEEYFNVK